MSVNFDIISFLSEYGIKHSSVKQSGYILLDKCPYCNKKRKAYVNIKNDKAPFGFFKCYSGSCQQKALLLRLFRHLQILVKKTPERCFMAKIINLLKRLN